VTTAEIAALVIALCGEPSAQLAEQISPTIAWESARTGIDARVAVAVMRSESGCRPGALGRRGEVGLFQVKPGATVARFCKDLRRRLWDPLANVECGMRVLAAYRRRCGGGPRRWLSLYSGRSCGPSRYGRVVMARLR
jgi:soluble lytic murein transglycosylase-like protein